MCLIVNYFSYVCMHLNDQIYRRVFMNRTSLYCYVTLCAVFTLFSYGIILIYRIFVLLQHKKLIQYNTIH